MKHEFVRDKVANKIEVARKNGVTRLCLYDLAMEILNENTDPSDRTVKRIQNIHVLVLDTVVELGLKIKLAEGERYD